MKSKLIKLIKTKMKPILDENQTVELENILISVLNNYNISEKVLNPSKLESNENQVLLDNFLSAKRVEGCSERTITYYRTTIFKMLDEVGLKIEDITTDDLRKYLADYKNKNNASKSTIDNVRRVLSSFFSWLEDEDYILKIQLEESVKLKPRKLLKKLLVMKILKS